MMERLDVFAAQAELGKLEAQQLKRPAQLGGRTRPARSSGCRERAGRHGNCRARGNTPAAWRPPGGRSGWLRGRWSPPLAGWRTRGLPRAAWPCASTSRCSQSRAGAAQFFQLRIATDWARGPPAAGSCGVPVQFLAQRGDPLHQSALRLPLKPAAAASETRSGRPGCATWPARCRRRPPRRSASRVPAPRDMRTSAS